MKFTRIQVFQVKQLGLSLKNKVKVLCEYEKQKRAP